MTKRDLVLTVVALLAAIPSLSQDYTQSSTGQARTCADLNMSFDQRATARAEQSLSFPLSEAPKLSFGESHNSGIEVTGWDRNEYSVTVCKVAAAATEAEAQQVLTQVEVQRNGGNLTVIGPENAGEQRWNAILLVMAPRSAGLDLSVHNGPISVENMAGGGEMRAHNGPIKLKDSSGDFVVETHNGPISYTGRAGTVKLNAKNGPISVELAGEQFTGQLTGEAKNGPIRLMLPPKFTSGVEVENYNAPMSCDADLCQGNVRMDGHHLTIGGSNAVIHLSTEHGPVTVQNRKKL
jgi:hypothetical protein